MEPDMRDNNYDGDRDARGKAQAYSVENFNGVLLSGTTIVAPMAQYQYHATEWPTKKRPEQRI